MTWEDFEGLYPGGREACRERVLPLVVILYHHLPLGRVAEFGRRAGFRFLWGQPRGGSSPLAPTDRPTNHAVFSKRAPPTYQRPRRSPRPGAAGRTRWAVRTLPPVIVLPSSLKVAPKRWDNGSPSRQSFHSPLPMVIS